MGSSALLLLWGFTTWDRCVRVTPGSNKDGEKLRADLWGGFNLAVMRPIQRLQLLILKFTLNACEWMFVLGHSYLLPDVNDFMWPSHPKGSYIDHFKTRKSILKSNRDGGRGENHRIRVASSVQTHGCCFHMAAMQTCVYHYIHVAVCDDIVSLNGYNNCRFRLVNVYAKWVVGQGGASCILVDYIY